MGGAHQAVNHLEGGEMGRGRGSPGSTSLGGGEMGRGRGSPGSTSLGGGEMGRGRGSPGSTSLGGGGVRWEGGGAHQAVLHLERG